VAPVLDSFDAAADGNLAAARLEEVAKWDSRDAWLEFRDQAGVTFVVYQLSKPEALPGSPRESPHSCEVVVEGIQPRSSGSMMSFADPQVENDEARVGIVGSGV